MFNFTQRCEMVYGKASIQNLSSKNVCILGVGGVGSYALEALVRSGIGSITIVDKDIVEYSNINRQLIALNSSIGLKKVDVAKERALDINPLLKIKALNMFYINKSDLDFSEFDYVLDAIDNVTGKIAIIEECTDKNIKLISAMGCGNRKYPSKLKLSDIYETSGCPLCKIVRKELKNRNIKELQVVYSTEDYVRNQSRTPGSTAFVPSVAGLLMAAEVVNTLIK